MAALFFACFALMVAGPAAASLGRIDQVQYAEISSPDGRYRFALDPSDRNGEGASAIAASVDGAEACSGELPFTFWRAEVTDDGLLVGFGYTNGFFAYSRPKPDAPDGVVEGEIVAAVVDSRGTVVCDRRHDRRVVRVVDSIPSTHVRLLRVDPQGRRMILVLDDEQFDSARARLWIVPFDESADTVEIRPLETLGSESGRLDGYLDDVRFVPETPLFALGWRTRGPSGWSQIVRRFALMDAARNVHWTFETNPVPTVHEGRLLEDRSAPRRFALYLDETAERVAFEVSESGDKWSAREISREAFQWSSPPHLDPPFNNPVPKPPAPPAEFPAVSPTLLGTTRLVFPPEANSPIRVGKFPRSFAVDEAGRFAFVRREPQPALVVVSPEGELEKEISLAALADAHLVPAPSVAYAGDRRYVLSASPTDKASSPPSHPCVVDAEIGTVAVLENVELRGLVEIAAGNGIIAYHGWMSSDINAGKVAAAHDLDGRLLWSLSKLDTGRPHPQFSPQAIAVLADGAIALLCKFPDAVYLFDRAGNRTATWNLDEAWGRKPKYVSDLVPAPDGGVYVGDFQGTPPCVRMTAEGKVAEELIPPARFLVPDFAGSLWYTDEYTFRRLDARMQTDRVVGNVPSTEQIGDLAASAVGPDGSLYLMSRRTNAVHVFGFDGARIRIVRPRADDAPGQSGHDIEYRIVPLDAGGFALAVGARAAFYDADGRRTGAIDHALESYRPQLAPRPDGKAWGIEYRSLKLFDRDGAVLKEIVRRHDRHWVEHPHDPLVAPDGSMVMFDGERAHVFDLSGEPRSSAPLPDPDARFRPCDYGGGLFVWASDGTVSALRDDGTPVFRFEPAHPDGKSAPWRPFVAAEGRELWLHDGEDLVLRYAMPSTTPLPPD